MKTGTPPERARSLVIDLAARTAIVDGTRVELPPTEFSLLAVLAARPGQLVSHKELLTEAFGDSAYMDRTHLHWRMWNIRRQIGDQDRQLIRNRRGEGFVLDMPPNAVKIIEGVAPAADDETTEVIRLDEPTEDSEAGGDGVTEAPDQGDVAVAAETEPVEAVRLVKRPRIRPATVLAVLLVTALVFGGSWLAGYRLSQWGAPPTGDSPRKQAAGDSSKGDRSGDRKKTSGSRGDGGKNSSKRGDASARLGAGASDSSDTSKSNQRSGVATKSGDTKGQNPPPAPKPDVKLYHLFNPDTTDHFMTTSSSAANQKQAAGYELSVEGLVFTTHEKGTVAIALDQGTAYVYRSRDAVPQGVSVTELHRLTKDGDLFYTSIPSRANQAEAQGWTRSVAGFVS